MTERPAPHARYHDEQLHDAFESGFAQMYDHASFVLLDRIEHAVDGVRGEADLCRRRAAMLEGCADALLRLAERQRDGAAVAGAVEEAPPA
jgi:hypothetical protein